MKEDSEISFDQRGEFSEKEKIIIRITTDFMRELEEWEPQDEKLEDARAMVVRSLEKISEILEHPESKLYSNIPDWGVLYKSIYQDKDINIVSYDVFYNLEALWGEKAKLLDKKSFDEIKPPFLDFYRSKNSEPEDQRAELDEEERNGVVSDFLKELYDWNEPPDLTEAKDIIIGYLENISSLFDDPENELDIENNLITGAMLYNGILKKKESQNEAPDIVSEEVFDYLDTLPGIDQKALKLLKDPFIEYFKNRNKKNTEVIRKNSDNNKKYLDFAFLLNIGVSIIYHLPASFLIFAVSMALISLAYKTSKRIISAMTGRKRIGLAGIIPQNKKSAVDNAKKTYPVKILGKRRHQVPKNLKIVLVSVLITLIGILAAPIVQGYSVGSQAPSFLTWLFQNIFLGNIASVIGRIVFILAVTLLLTIFEAHRKIDNRRPLRKQLLAELVNIENSFLEPALGLESLFQKKNDSPLDNTSKVDLYSDFPIIDAENPPLELAEAILNSESGLPSYIFTDKDFGGEILCSETIKIAGKKAKISVKIKICQDKENSKGKVALIYPFCSDKTIPKEMVLGRGSLMALSKISKDDTLVKIPEGFPKGNAQRFIIEMHGPKTALAAPRAVIDEFTQNHSFLQSFSIYDAASEPDETKMAAEEINPGFSALVKNVSGEEIDLNRAGIFASDCTLSDDEIYGGEFSGIVSKPAPFKLNTLEKLEWMKTNVFIPGLLSRRNGKNEDLDNILILNPSELPERDITLIPGFAKKGNIPNFLLTGWNESDYFAGDTVTLNYGRLIDGYHFKDSDGKEIDYESILTSKDGRNTGQSSRAAAKELQLKVAWKIFNNIIDFKKLEALINTFPDDKIRLETVNEFKHLAYEDLGDEKNEALLEALKKDVGRVYHKIFNPELLKERLAYYASDEATGEEIQKLLTANKVSEFYRDGSRVDVEIEKGERKLAEDTFGALLMEGDLDFFLEVNKKVEEEGVAETKAKIAMNNYEKLNSCIDRKKVYKKLTRYIKPLIFNTTFLNYPKNKGLEAAYSLESEETGTLVNVMHGNFYIYNLFGFMLQMFYFDQMSEVVKELHAEKRKIYLEVNLNKIDSETPDLFKYLFDTGIDGVKLVIADGEIEKGEKINFKKYLKKLNRRIKESNPDGKVFVRVPEESQIEECIFENTDFSRDILLGENRRIDDNDMLEVEKSADTPAEIKQLLSDIKNAAENGARKIAVKTSIVYGDYYADNSLTPEACSIKDVFSNFFNPLRPFTVVRPKNPVVLAKQGHDAGVENSEIPELEDGYIEKVNRENPYWKFSFENPDLILENGILGLMKALHNLKFSGESLSKLIDKKGVKNILNLALNAVEKTKGLGKDEWKSGWFKLRYYVDAINSAEDENTKKGYVIELYEYLRGRTEMMVEKDFDKKNNIEFVDNYSHKMFRPLLLLRIILNLDGGKREYLPPENFGQGELSRVLAVDDPLELPQGLSDILPEGRDLLSENNSDFAVFYLNALLHLKAIMKKKPKFDYNSIFPVNSRFIGKKEITEGFGSKTRIREMLKPTLDKVYREGLLKDLSGMDRQYYEGTVSALYNLFFYNLAQRRYEEDVENYIEESSINLDAVESITKAS